MPPARSRANPAEKENQEAVSARREMILSHVRVNGYTRLSALAKLTGVSELTVRRDLKRLASEGEIRIVPGGATADGVSGSMIHFRREIELRQNQKRAIAAAAANLVPSGASVLIDGGSTTYYVAQALKGRKVQVVTNSIPVAEVFSPDSGVDVLVLGGKPYPATGILLGVVTERQVKELNCSLVFMGFSAVDEKGFTNTNLELIETEKVMLGSARRRIMVGDSSKAGKREFGLVADPRNVDVLVTDAGFPRPLRKSLEKAGVEVVIAPEKR